MMSSEYKLWKRMQGQTKDYKGNVFHTMISWHWEVNKNPSQGLSKHPSTWLVPGKTIPGRESNNEGTLGRCFLLKPATRGNNFVSPYIFEVPIIPPHRKESGFNFTQFETGELD